MLAELKRKLMLAVLRRYDEDSDGAGGGGRGGTNKSSDGGGDSGASGDGDSGSGGNSSDDAGKTLDNAAETSSSGWGKADYGEGGQEVGLHDVLGTDGTASDLANRLKETPAGFNEDGSPVARTDRDVSEGMAAAGIGFLDRAREVGAIDAITQGDFTRGLSRAVEMGLALSNPLAAPAMAVGDAVVDGASTGKWGRLGGLAGGVIGARAGLDIASGFANSANGAIAAALGGTALGGAAGAGLGRAIASGQGVAPSGEQVTREGEGGQAVAAAPTPATSTAPSSPGADGMGHSFYDFIARYGAGAASKG